MACDLCSLPVVLPLFLSGIPFSVQGVTFNKRTKSTFIIHESDTRNVKKFGSVPKRMSKELKAPQAGSDIKTLYLRPGKKEKGNKKISPGPVGAENTKPRGESVFSRICSFAGCRLVRCVWCCW